MVALSHETHHLPELAAVRSGGCKHAFKGRRHMTNSGAITESSAGTYEVGMLTVNQTVLLIIHLLHTTTLAKAVGPVQAVHPARMHAQKMAPKPEAHASTDAVTRQSQAKVGREGA